MIRDSKVVTRIDLDVSLPDVQKSVSITQGENKRRWIFSLTNGGEPIEVPPRWTAILTGTKPDGTVLYNGTIVERGRIVYDFSSGEQVSAVAGTYPIQLEIYGEDGELVFSPKLWVGVFPNLSTVGAAQSTSEFTAMGKFVESINEVYDRLDDSEQKLEDIEKAASGDGVPVAIDLSRLDGGEIVETFSDGSTKTTAIEYDADGNPIKITDGDGNATDLIW